MDVNEARQYLDRFPRFEVKPGLSRIRHLVESIHEPHLAYRTIHIGGTNGKGSVSAMLDAVLRQAGYRVGRFTSPELIDFRDRIVIDGEWISERELADAVARLKPTLESLDETPSQFEVIAAIAFEHLAHSNVDVGVIEVGLGGRFDATNVVIPEVAIVTNVTLDHQAILGDTIEKIAWEKAGIAKPGVALVMGDLLPAAEAVVRAECDAVGAIVKTTSSIHASRIALDWDAAVYRINGVGDIQEVILPLIGSAQRDNLKLVLAAIMQLREKGFELSDEDVVQGLRSVDWPGRLEVARRRPTVLLDGAHNPAAMEALVADVAELVPNPEQRFLLYGTLADKNVDASLSLLADVFPAAGLCASRSPRALPIEPLYEIASRHFSRLSQYHSVAEGVNVWLAHADPEDVLVITGSLTVVGEARHWLMEAH